MHRCLSKKGDRHPRCFVWLKSIARLPGASPPFWIGGLRVCGDSKHVFRTRETELFLHDIPERCACDVAFDVLANEERSVIESTARLHNLIESLSERLAPFCSSRDDQAKMAAVPVDPPTIRPDSQFEFAMVEVNQRVQIAANRIAHLLDTMRI